MLTIARRSNTSMLTATCSLAGTYCPDLRIAEAFRSWESGLTQLACFSSELRLEIASYTHPTGTSSSWMILSTASLKLCHSDVGIRAFVLYCEQTGSVGFVARVGHDGPARVAAEDLFSAAVDSFFSRRRSSRAAGVLERRYSTIHPH